MLNRALFVLALAAILGAVLVAAAARQSRRDAVRVKAMSCLSDAAVRAATTRAVAAAEDERLWKFLAEGGRVVLMRHAKTPPGAGDPANFKLGDCSTQRNLSDEGRAQAKAIGEALLQRGVRFSDVRSSQWCRCLDTARLVAGAVEEEPLLNSMLKDAEDRDARVGQMRELAARRPTYGNALLVTHQINITALTDLTPQMGDMVIVTPNGNGSFVVEGQLHIPLATTNKAP